MWCKLNTLLLAILTIPSQAELKPYYFAKQPNAAGIGYVLRTIDKYELELPKSQVLGLKQLHNYYVDSPAAAEVRYMDGRVSRIAHCLSIDTVEDFKQYVVGQARQLGRPIKWSGDSLAAIESQAESLPVIWFKYSDKVCAQTPHPTLSKLDLAQVGLWFVESHQKSKFLTLSFDDVPQAYKEETLSAMRRVLNAGIQQRDDEAAGQYELRRASSGIAALLVERLTADMTRFAVWSQFPSADEQRGFRGNFSLSVREGSQSQAMFSGLQLKKTKLAVRYESGVAGWLEIHAQLPVKPDERSVTSGGGLIDAITGTIARGQIDGIVVLPSEEENVGLLAALWNQTHSKSSGQTLLNFADVSQNLAKPFKTLSAATTAENDWIAAAISTKPDLREVDRVITKKAKRIAPPLFSLTVDLAKWPQRLSSESGSYAILTSLERAFDIWTYEDAAKRQREAIADTLKQVEARDGRDTAREFERLWTYRPMTENFTSSLSSARLNNDGDWRVASKIGVVNRGTRLEGRLTIGSELHQLYTARNLLAAKRFSESAP